MNLTHRQSNMKKRAGFSMIELLAAVAIMGVIAFMAIPSVTKMRADSERNLAISRAEALNIALATYVQAAGRSTADQSWSNATTANAKYLLLRPYLAFAETSISLYMPSGYSINFGNTAATSMTKCTLLDTSNAQVFY